MKNLFRKLLSVALMIIAPIVAGKALYEYVGVTYLNWKPSYPFGKEFMKTIQVKDISYLASYQNELLTIGVVFLAITIIAYISMMIKALVNLIWLALVIFVGYYGYHLFGH